jgi:hypothetical protein
MSGTRFGSDFTSSLIWGKTGRRGVDRWNARKRNAIKRKWDETTGKMKIGKQCLPAPGTARGR